jgi:ATP-dependent Zn protease
MVAEFGMGVPLDADGAPPIALPTGDYALSDRTRRDVDLAAMTLAREALRRARSLLAANRECLDDLAANALERETLTREDLDEIFAAHRLVDCRKRRYVAVQPAATLSSSEPPPQPE